MNKKKRRSSIVLAGGQEVLEFVEREDVAWGVLSDGTAIVSARGLATLCGVQASTMIELAQEWTRDSSKKRDQLIQRYAEDLGYFEESLRIDVEGQPAFIDRVAIAILQYYAENAAPPKEEARRVLMAFAGLGFREYVYRQIGYKKPLTDIDMLRDRALLNQAPAGFFSIFQESMAFVIRLLQQGMKADPHTVPDISIGSCWAEHWKKNDLEAKFGATKKAPHAYPEYYPQSRSQDVIHVNVYPEVALGEFRQWLREVYVPVKLSNYLVNKQQAGVLSEHEVRLILLAAGHKSLPEP